MADKLDFEMNSTARAKLVRYLNKHARMKKTKVKFQYPSRSNQIPVTQKMLYSVRDELKSDLAALRSEVKSDIAALRSEFKSELKSEIGSLRAELRTETGSLRRETGSLRTELSSIRAEQVALRNAMETMSHQLKSEIHRIALLVEEQNARNNVVLDGLTFLFERQERLESSR